MLKKPLKLTKDDWNSFETKKVIKMPLKLNKMTEIPLKFKMTKIFQKHKEGPKYPQILKIDQNILEI